ncbi:MAG: hypothetical protein JNL74_03775 [Fibrobacteres bacterium]|nr:hypothetical protein [Fibrobacterota bacterium]
MKLFNSMDYVSVGIYIFVFIMIGWWFTRLKMDSDTFFSSSKQLPGWLAGISYFMSGYSANIFTAGVAAYVMVGIAPLYSAISSTIAGALFAYIWAAKWWHNSGTDSVPEYFNKIYGKIAHKFLLGSNLPALILGDAIRFYISGILVATVTGMPFFMSLMITSVLLFAYLVSGGLWGSIITDTVQCFVLFLLLIMMLVLSLAKIGGLDALIAGFPEGHTMAFPGGGFSFFQGATAAESWCISSFVVGILLIGPMNDSTIWMCVQRYTSSKNIKETRKVPLYYVGLTIPMLIMIAIPAIAARIFIPEIATSWTSAEMAYITAAKILLPHGILALLITGILSANLSTLSSNAVIYSQTISNDIYRSYLNPTADSKKMLVVGRIIMGSCIVFCMALALLVPKVGGILWSNMLLGSIVAPAMGAPVFISLFYKKTPGWGVVVSCVAGMITGTILNFACKLGFTDMEIAFWIRGVVPFMVVLLGMLITGVLFPPTGEKKKEIDKMSYCMKYGADAVYKEGEVSPQQECKKEILPPSFFPVNAMVGVPLIIFGIQTTFSVQMDTDFGSIIYITGMLLSAALLVFGISLIRSNQIKKREYFKSTGHY